MSSAKTREVKAALLRKGFAGESKRDHLYYFFLNEGTKTRIYTKISHGETDIGDPLQSQMSKQMKLTRSQFKDFVSCTLSGDQYLRLLLDLGVTL